MTTLAPFLIQVVALGVLLEKFVSMRRDWNGSPEVKIIRDALVQQGNILAELNTTLKSLVMELNTTVQRALEKR